MTKREQLKLTFSSRLTLTVFRNSCSLVGRKEDDANTNLLKLKVYRMSFLRQQDKMTFRTGRNRL